MKITEMVDEQQLTELNVIKTAGLAKTAHQGQFYGDKPYFAHPKAVALTGKKIFGNKFNSDAVKVALLHDVVEDTNIDLQQLSKYEFSQDILDAVKLLTKDKSLTYRQNIERIINSGNILAIMVKYADNYQNYISNKDSWDPKKRESSQKKYLNSLNMLGNKLGINYHKISG